MPLRGRLSREKNTSKGSWGLPSGRLSIGCDLCDLLSLAMGMGTTVVAPVQRQFFTLFALYFYVTHQRFHTFVYNEQDVTQIGYGTLRPSS